MNAPKPTRIVLRLVRAVLLGFLICCFFVPFLFPEPSQETMRALLFGWIDFPRYSLEHMRWDWNAVATGFIFLGIGFLSFHWLAAWFAFRSSSSRWKWRSTAVLCCAFAWVFVVAIGSACLGRALHSLVLGEDKWFAPKDWVLFELKQNAERRKRSQE